MAVGKKTGGRDFSPGTTGNPTGRPKVPEDLKFAKIINKIEFERLLNKLFKLNASKVEATVIDPEVPISEQIVAAFLVHAKKNASIYHLNFMLDRLIGVPKDEPDIPEDFDYGTLPSQVKTFEQFCATAGYFKPYPKQVEMKDFVIGETETRLLLGSRGYGKTDFGTIMGIAYDLYVHYTLGHDMSEHTNLIITKSKSRNKAICQEIGDALLKNGVLLAKKNSSEIRVKGLIGQDHSVEAITIKTSMRGRHPKRIVMDDPVTEEDTSEAMRKTVKDRYDEAYKLCKNICIIGQPSHAHDLYAKLRGILKKMEVPWGTIPELDADLEAMKLAGIDQNSIEMSYHLRIPVSGSAPFSKIKYIDKFPTTDAVAFIDPSDGGDFTAVSIVTGLMQGVAVVGKEWKRAWYHALDGEDGMIKFLLANRVKKICFETNHAGKQPLEQLRQVLGPHGIGVQGVHSASNKHATIMSAGSYAPMIHLSKESDRSYTDHVVEYEYGAKFDDAPDSLARCLVWIGLIKGK